MIAQDIIIKPVITEKTMIGVASGKKYTFVVAKNATKKFHQSNLRGRVNKHDWWIIWWNV